METIEKEKLKTKKTRKKEKSSKKTKRQSPIKLKKIKYYSDYLNYLEKSLLDKKKEKKIFNVTIKLHENEVFSNVPIQILQVIHLKEGEECPERIANFVEKVPSEERGTYDKTKEALIIIFWLLDEKTRKKSKNPNSNGLEVPTLFIDDESYQFSFQEFDYKYELKSK
jgi:hypothetical protein